MNITKHLRNQKGVTIIAVFFVLLMLGALGMAVSKLTQSQQMQSAKAIQVQTAYYSARSGLEWAYQRCFELWAVNPANCNSDDFSSLPSVLQTYTINGKTLEFTLSFNGNALTSTSEVGGSGGGKRSITFATFGSNFIPDASGTCGDGVVDDGEECDDSNTVDGDGCSSTCTIEQQPTIPGDDTSSGDGVSGCSGSLDMDSTIFPNDADFPNYPDFPGYDPAAWPDGDNLGAVDMRGRQNLTLDSGTYLMSSLIMEGRSTLTITGPALIYVTGTASIAGNNLTTIGGNVKFIVLGDFDAGGSFDLSLAGELDIAATGTINIDTGGFSCTG